MNNITIRKSVRPEIVRIIPDLTLEALIWLDIKYPTVDFNKVDYIFSSAYKRSRYFRNELKDAKYLAPNVCISTRATLGLYDMKTLKLKKQWIFTGSPIQMMCALIHELTHHAQYELKLPTGELETTRNELEYLQEFHPRIHKKLVKK